MLLYTHTHAESNPTSSHQSRATSLAKASISSHVGDSQSDPTGVSVFTLDLIIPDMVASGINSSQFPAQNSQVARWPRSAP